MASVRMTRCMLGKWLLASSPQLAFASLLLISVTLNSACTSQVEFGSAPAVKTAKSATASSSPKSADADGSKGATQTSTPSTDGTPGAVLAAPIATPSTAAVTQTDPAQPQALPSCTLVSDQASLATGGTATLTLYLENTTKASTVMMGAGQQITALIDGNAVAVNGAGIGVLPVTPNATHTYLANVTAPSGRASCSTKVTVLSLPTCTLTAAAATVAPGKDTLLTVSATGDGLISAAIDDTPVVLTAGSGTLAVSPQAAHTYQASVVGAGGTGTCSVAVALIAAPTCTLTASPVQVASGATAKLLLALSGGPASGATVDQEALAIAGGTGNLSVTPASTHTYQASVSGPGGASTCSAVVTVTPPPTCTLTAAPANIRAGDSTTLTLVSAGSAVSSATIDNAGVTLNAGSATQTVSPALTHTFSAAVNGPFGTGTCSAALTVQQPVELKAPPLTLNVASSQGYVWLVSMQENVFRIHLDEAATYPTESWTIPNGASGGCGHRTFVSEIGLLFNDGCDARLYRASDDVPTPGQAQLLWTNTEDTVGSSHRMCVTSFKIGTQAYVGAAYTNSANHRRLAIIPIDPTKPTKVDTAKMQIIEGGTGAFWGYSCFIDQSRNIFWSAYVEGTPYGIDLNTMTPVTTAAAQNGAYALELSTGTMLKVKLGSRASYAISGDQSGNIISGNVGSNNIYYATYESVSNAVYASILGGPAVNGKTNILVADAGCFSTLSAAECASKSFLYPTPDTGTLHAMSSLNDGRIVTIDQAGGKIYLAAANNPHDLSQGIRYTLVKTVPNNTFYMYTDFTGATAYAVSSTNLVDLTSLNGYLPGRTVRSLSWTWHTGDGAVDSWHGLALSVRCYNKGDGQLPALTPVGTVANAESATNIAVGSCAAAPGTYNQVDIHLDPLPGSGSSFSRISSFVLQASL